MRFRRGTLVVLAAALGLGGCAAGAAAGPTTATSPTGRTYAPGTPPSNTRQSNAAQLAIAQANFQEAMNQAREGMAAAPTNPIHYYLAGEAAAGMKNYALADSLWKEAERIFPAYELDVEPSRERAWAGAFNEGVEAYNAGTMAAAIAAWQNAHLIYKYRPDAVQNLALVLSQEERYDEAIKAYQEGIAELDLVPATRTFAPEEVTQRDEARADMKKQLAQLLVFTMKYAEAEALLREVVAANPDDPDAQVNLALTLGQLGREAEAVQIYTQLLARSDVPPEQLFNIGITLFNAGVAATGAAKKDAYLRAAQAFDKVTQAWSNNRDAWVNRANALYAAADAAPTPEDWAAVVGVAERAHQVDPLNENLALILARAYREAARNQEALATLQTFESVPVKLDDLLMQPAAQQTRVTGKVLGQNAAPGTPIRLRFTFYNGSGSLGSQEVTVNAPAREASQDFEVVFTMPADYYSYEMLP